MRPVTSGRMQCGSGEHCIVDDLCDFAERLNLAGPCLTAIDATRPKAKVRQ